MRCYRQLSLTPSAAIGPWCEKMSRPASTWCAELPRDMPRLGRATGSDTIGTSRALVHADGCIKKCPHFRDSMLRAPVSHTIDSNFYMVRADTSNNLGTCLALLQAAGSQSIRSNCDMVRADASTCLDLVCRTASGHACLSCGRLAHTSLARAGPWYIRLPV